MKFAIKENVIIFDITTLIGFLNNHKKVSKMKNKLLDKTFAVLTEIVNSDGAVSIKSISQKLAINVSTVSRIVSDLQEQGLVAKASYHDVEIALGAIQIGQNAINNFPLTKLINPMIYIKARELEVNAALAGVLDDQVVYLYRTQMDEDCFKVGMPFRRRIYASNIAITILVKKYGVEKAFELVKISHAKHSEENITLGDIHELMLSMEKNNYLLRVDSNQSWNICFPLEFNNDIFGISFYGKKANEQSFTKILFELSLLMIKINGKLVSCQAKIVSKTIRIKI